ncbi:NAD-dependent epimerase/dehydratase family protein [Tautonia plasticadhaerens]|uniref:NAD dependent epimerase/dehydratase family protein n=1 Tax=Tautonia plasticadhaerens TaxID=2527974 RepID=A0A518HF35_9BACT|nr:NAD-dependent epimerase/dehydratase family protein [Tautonia plasticadhaerens]QDV39452.1 NAD dependent epimerase/dehydratase family protein [Tautonia plasticadhaerens]
MRIDRRRFLRASAAGPWLAAGAGVPRIAGAATNDARPKTILMLGGTGFLGPHTVEAALRRGHEVTLFNRGRTRPGLFPDLEQLRGDRDNDLKALEGRRWDAVVDTSANIPRWVRSAAAVLGPNIGHYVYISSISAYASLTKPGTDESAPLAEIADPTVEQVDGETFGALKALSEKAAEEAMPGRVTVVRPGLIAGPDDPSDRFAYWPVRVARGGEVLAPGSAEDPVQLIDVRDLGEFLVTLIEGTTTGVFNALGPAGGLTMGRMLDACKEAAGSDATFTFVPARFLAEQGVSAWSDMPAWVPAEGDTAGFARVSNAKAIGVGLGFRPIVETARATLEWFEAQPEERRSRLRAGLAPGREAEVLAAWKARDEQG